MTLLRKKRVLAAKIETTAGTAITLGSADAAFNVYDAEIQPNIETIERQSEGSFSQQSSIAGSRSGTVTFKTYLEGDGAGGVPDWASTFLPACGAVDDGSGVFELKTESPGTNVKTLTIGVYTDGKLETIHGAVGTVKVSFPAGKLIMFDWSFQGLYNVPTDVAIIAPTYPTDRPFRWAGGTFTLGGASVGATSTIELDLGNEITLIPTGTTAQGFTTGLIAGRKVVGSMDSQSRLVATEDVHGEWLSGTEQAMVLEVADANDTITFAAPKVQRNNVQAADRNGEAIDNVTFQCNKSAAAGNDELTITFAAT